MCGICGIYNARSEEPASREVLERMTHLIAHRGPDDSDIYLDGAVGLGSTRLSIIDLGSGHQPMSNEAGDTWIVFNGEIWNYQTLRRRLVEKGHSFRTQSDTETIVHAYEEYGVDCVSHLHGMFAFAIWDTRRHRLFLARDRLGKKPLYYTQVAGDLIFGSEIKSLLCHPRVKPQVDLQAMTDFLSVRYVPGPATLFAGIYKVLPGHRLVVEGERVRQECYWDFTFHTPEQRSVEEYIQGIRHHIYRAVEERMVADVPVGALLSGGVDSSIIVGMMSQLTGERVKTFSVGFDVPGYSELPYARLVADHFGTDHHELVIKSTDLADCWPLLTWHRDEPVSEPSDVGVYLVSRLARQHVKVVLTGEGGDELFAGYPKYVYDGLARYYHLLPAAVRNQVVTPLLDRLPHGLRKLKFAARSLSQPAPQRWMQWFGVFNGELKEHLLSDTTKASVDLDASRMFQWWLEQTPPRDDLSAMLYLDTKIWLPDNLLMKADKMTMAASVEARVPFLDSYLVQYAADIPSNLKIKPFHAKYLLKRAFADFIPRPILSRKKMGFNVPIGAWFRTEQRNLVTQLLLSDRARDRGLLAHEFIERLVTDELEGRAKTKNQLFILASLELWFRVFIDTPALAPQESVIDLVEANNARRARAVSVRG